MRHFAAAFCALIAVPAAAATLTFDGEPFSRLGAEISPDYGDLYTEVAIPGAPPIRRKSLNVTPYAYNLSNPSQRAPVIYYDEFNGQGYGAGARNGVAIAAQDGFIAGFFFKPAAGMTVRLSSFDVASYPNGQTALTGGFAVYDGAGRALWSSRESVSGAKRTISLELSSATGLHLRWGADFNIGVDNITYSVAPTADPAAPIPLPAPALLLAGGLAALGALRRR